jgi:hypothetical protein
MAASGTTISSLLSDPDEQAQVVTPADDTLEGAASGEPSPFADASVSSDYFYWAVPGEPVPGEADAPAAGESDSEGSEPQAGSDPGFGAHAPIGGASLVAGDSVGFDGMRIAIGDWNDRDWTGIHKLPWIDGDNTGFIIGLPEFGGDGFGDAAPGEYGYYADGGDYAYDGYYGYYGSYYGDGSGDIGGDGFEGAYDDEYYYGSYTITSAGDINGDGFEDFLVEGYGYSYVQYGGDYSYAGDGDYAYAGDGDYSYAGDGPVHPAIEPGVIFFSPGDGVALNRVSIQISGDTILNWNDFVISAGDSQVFVGSDNTIALSAATSGIRLSTAAIIGELNTFIAD